MRFSHDLKNYADREGCYRPRRVKSYESLGWDQATHRGKKEKWNMLNQKKKKVVERCSNLLRSCYSVLE